MALEGDLPEETGVTIFSSQQIDSATWNGSPIKNVEKISPGIWTGTISFTNVSLDNFLPDLTNSVWKYADSLPEIGSDFDASDMVVANHTATTSVFPPYYGGPWILYADDYGFHASDLVTYFDIF